MERDQLIKELCEAIPGSTKAIKDQWDVIMEGRLFRRIQQLCEERGISHDELTPEEWRKLAIEVALDKHKE